VTGEVRALRELVGGGSADVNAFNAALAKANEAVKNFQKTLNQPGAGIPLPQAERDAMTKRIADEVQAIRTEALRPVITPPSGGLIDAANLVISTGVRGTEIRYTLDGGDPVQNGQVYAGPMSLAAPIAVKAVADLPGQVKAGSPAAEASYRKLEARPAESVSDLQPGLKLAYTEGTFRSLAEAAAQKVLKTDVCKTFDISQWLFKDWYAVTFTGYIKAPADGAYVFYLTSDDGSQLYIGQTLVVSNDGRHPAQTARGEIGLRAGFHAIKVPFFEHNGDEMLKVEYEGPGVRRQTVPGSVLFHKP